MTVQMSAPVYLVVTNWGQGHLVGAYTKLSTARGQQTKTKAWASVIITVNSGEITE